MSLENADIPGEDSEETLEEFRAHMAEVEIEHFERTGDPSSYALLGKTWAEMGFPEP